MTNFRIRLELRGPLSTPLHSGTLFGHLCWARRELDGEAALTRWLAALEEEPFLISDAFPAGRLPRPLLKPVRPDQGPIRTEDDLARAQSAKELRKLSWIEVADFLALRGAMEEPALLQRLEGQEEETPSLRTVRAAHNTIDRLTGTTPESGGLFFMEEHWPHQDGPVSRDLYLRASTAAADLQRLFAHVGRHGFGKDASTGRGQFRATVEQAPLELFGASGNRLLSLSHGSLTENMEQPRYRVHVHYGKAGSLYAVAGKPFKHPFTLLHPGATFRAQGEGPFGELLHHVHKDYPEIVHNAWHLAIPYQEVEERNARSRP